MRNQTKREVDGRYALEFSTRKSVVRFEDRAAQRKARQDKLYQAALARGLSEAQAEEEMFLFAV